MRGDQAIIAERKRGMRPAVVHLLPDGARVSGIGDVTISPTERADLRFLIGLDVVAVVPAWSVEVGAFWDRIKAAKPAFALLAVLEWGEDIGLKWMPGYADTPAGEDWNG